MNPTVRVRIHVCKTLTWRGTAIAIGTAFLLFLAYRRMGKGVDHSRCSEGVRWPRFETNASMSNEWRQSFELVYGPLPPEAFPLDTGHRQMWSVAPPIRVPTSNDCACFRGGTPAKHGRWFFFDPQAALWVFDGDRSPSPSHARVEITHCRAEDAVERGGLWGYRTVGSGVFADIGSTIAFAHHEDAWRHFAVSRAGGDTDWHVVYERARASGFDSLQFTGHWDMRCGNDAVEIVFLGVKGVEAPCSSGLRLYAGWNGSRPCRCVRMPNVLVDAMCISCALTG